MLLERVYMLNTAVDNCTKDVYNLWEQTSISGAYLSPEAHRLVINPQLPSAKLHFLPNLINSYTPFIYTAKYRLFNLLNHWLYTVSTPPTITKVNKKFKKSNNK